MSLAPRIDFSVKNAQQDDFCIIQITFIPPYFVDTKKHLHGFIQRISHSSPMITSLSFKPYDSQRARRIRMMISPRTDFLASSFTFYSSSNRLQLKFTILYYTLMRKLITLPMPGNNALTNIPTAAEYTCRKMTALRNDLLYFISICTGFCLLPFCFFLSPLLD